MFRAEKFFVVKDYLQYNIPWSHLTNVQTNLHILTTKTIPNRAIPPRLRTTARQRQRYDIAEVVEKI